MKRFAVFAGYEYYPAGGMYDFKGSFDTKAEASSFAASIGRDWMHIADTESGLVFGEKPRFPDAEADEPVGWNFLNRGVE